MKRALWIIAILLGLGVIAAILCKKMCGECHCHGGDGEEKGERNGKTQQIDEEEEEEQIQEEEEEEVS